MKKCLIYVEKIHPRDAVDLLDAVDRLYGSENAKVYGFGDEEVLQSLEGYFDVLIPSGNEQLDPYNIKTLTNRLEELHEAFIFDSILILATHIGRMLAPRLAMRLQTGLVADITGINADGDRIELIRPAYSGKLMAAITIRGTGPMMMTVRQKVFQWEEKRVSNSQWNLFEFKDSGVVQKKNASMELLRSEDKEGFTDIRESEILVAGGRGTASYFVELESLAKVLNAQVAASRKIIDQQIAPRRIQVGQSGKTVNPKLYIAIGISGAIQHIEGLKNVEHVIAVNKKSRAPICSIADIVVEGDGKEFIEKLLRRIRRGDEI